MYKHIDHSAEDIKHSSLSKYLLHSRLRARCHEVLLLNWLYRTHKYTGRWNSVNIIAACSITPHNVGHCLCHGKGHELNAQGYRQTQSLVKSPNDRNNCVRLYDIRFMRVCGYWTVFWLYGAQLDRNRQRKKKLLIVCLRLLCRSQRMNTSQGSWSKIYVFLISKSIFFWKKLGIRWKILGTICILYYYWTNSTELIMCLTVWIWTTMPDWMTMSDC